MLCFAEMQCQTSATEILKVQPDHDNKDVATGCSHDLTETLLYLAGNGHSMQEVGLLAFPRSNCPDVVVLGLLQINPPITNLKQEFQMFLAPHPDCKAAKGANVANTDIKENEVSQWRILHDESLQGNHLLQGEQLQQAGVQCTQPPQHEGREEQLGHEEGNNLQVIPVVIKIDSSGLKVFSTYLHRVESRKTADRQHQTDSPKPVQSDLTFQRDTNHDDAKNGSVSNREDDLLGFVEKQ